MFLSKQFHSYIYLQIRFNLTCQINSDLRKYHHKIILNLESLNFRVIEYGFAYCTLHKTLSLCEVGMEWSDDKAKFPLIKKGGISFKFSKTHKKVRTTGLDLCFSSPAVYENYLDTSKCQYISPTG